MYLLVNVSPPKPLDVASSNFYSCIGNMIYRVLGNILRDQGQGHIMNFLVNASPKPLDIATSNYACA